MTWLASLTRISEGELDRLIKRIAAILVVGSLVVRRLLRPRSLADAGHRRWSTSAIASPRAGRPRRPGRHRVPRPARRPLRRRRAVRGGDRPIRRDPRDRQGGRAGPLRAGHGASRRCGDLDARGADYQAVVDIAKDGEMAHVDPTLNAAYYGLGSIALEQEQPADAVEHLVGRGRDQALGRRRPEPARHGLRPERRAGQGDRAARAARSPSCRSAGASRT